MRFSFLVVVILNLSLIGLSRGADRTLIQVPYHSQFGEGNPVSPNSWSTVACLNMVFDYYEDVPGPPFCQPEIAMVVNTDDLGGSFRWDGTLADDARRGCHFSVLSLSLNGGLQGYSWRATGYGAVDTSWHWSVLEVKSVLDLGYPLVVHSAPGPLDSLYRSDGSPFDEPSETTAVGHSRVLVGYDDTLSPPAFFMHDPWSPASDSAGAFIWCTQTYFAAVVWPQHSEFLFTAPWELSVEHPGTLDMNSSISIKGRVQYSAPPVLTGIFPVSDASVRLVLPSGISFEAGDSSLHLLPGITAAGGVDSTEWRLAAGEVASDDSFLLYARGIVSSNSNSYPAGYVDSIGGAMVSAVHVADVSAPTITVIYPDGGEVIGGGEEDTVRWAAWDNVGVVSVDLLLSVDGGFTWDTLASNEENDSSCVCLFPYLDSDSCKITALARDAAANAASDASDSFFTIRRTGVSETEVTGRVNRFHVGVEPNPFNREAVVTYTLEADEEGRVLTVHDTAGRMVRGMEMGSASGGRGRLVWDGRDEHGETLPSGVYFLRVVTSKRTESRTVLVIR